MSVSDAASGELLAALMAAPAAERADLLRAAGNGAFETLCAEVERLTVTEISRAVEAADIVAEVALTCGSLLDRAKARRVRAQALAYAGRFEEALADFQESSRLAREAGSEVEAARAQMSSIHALASLGRLDEAIQAGIAAHTAFQAAGLHALAARADSNVGTAYQMRDEPRAALRHFDRARPALLAEPAALAQLDSNRAHALMALNEFDAAQQAYDASLPTFIEAGMSWAAAIVEGNLADLATRGGRLHTALLHFERARRYLEEDSSPAELARLSAERAEALSQLGMLEEARAEYERALPELESQTLALETVRARAGLGQVLVRLDRLDAAQPVLDAASAEYEALGQSTAGGRVNLIRAELALRRGEHARAAELAEKATATFADRAADAAAARHQRARIALVAGDDARAAQELDAAVQTARELDLAPLLADLLHARGLLHERKGALPQASTDLHAAIEQVERIRGALQAERFRTAFHGDRLAVYDDLARVLLARLEAAPTDRYLAADLFTTIERGKSRSLLDLMQGALDWEPEDAGAPPASDAEAQMLADLSRRRAELSGLYSRLADAARDGAPVSDDLRERLRAGERAIELLETRLATTRGAGGLYARTVSLEQVQALLAERHDATEPGVLVEYFASGRDLSALVIRADGWTVRRNLATLEQVSEIGRRVAFQIRRALQPGVAGSRAERLLADVQRELHAAYRSIFAPLQVDTRSAHRLYVVPHGPLHAFPLHALFDGKRYLVECCELRFAPSASLLARGTARAAFARDRRRAALVVGVADADAPQIEDEARQVVHALNAKSSLIGPSATVARFAIEAPHYDVIHLACHGAFLPENPHSSGLRLADRWLTVREIYGLRLHSELVTLSGCETGRSVVSRGEELLGLVRAFLAAGAAGLTVSLWAVNDASTAEFMELFYREWRYNTGGEGAAGALRRAQLTHMQGRPHPAHWAPFIYLGDA